MSEKKNIVGEWKPVSEWDPPENFTPLLVARRAGDSCAANPGWYSGDNDRIVVTHIITGEKGFIYPSQRGAWGLYTHFAIIDLMPEGIEAYRKKDVFLCKPHNLDDDGTFSIRIEADNVMEAAEFFAEQWDYKTGEYGYASGNLDIVIVTGDDGRNVRLRVSAVESLMYTARRTHDRI